MSDPLPTVVALRTLPDRPDLDHLRGQAKMLLDALRAGDSAATTRMARAAPHCKAPWQLADAQFGIAREYGFASWPKIVAHVESVRAYNDRSERVKQDFLAAIDAGDVPALSALLEREPIARTLVNAPIYSFGGRPIAQSKSNAALLDLLIAYGADINLKSDWWAGAWGVLDTATPEEAALLISRGATIDIFAAAHLDRVEKLQSLLDADASLVHAKGGDGGRPLHFAKSAAAIDLLIARGADLEARDVDHESTALQWALPRADATSNGSANEPLARCRLLAERGANVDVFAAAAMNDPVLLARALDAHETAIAARVKAPGYPPCPHAPGGHVYAYTLGSGLTPHAVAAAFGSDAALALLMERSSSKQRFIAACTSGRGDEARAMLRDHPQLLSELDDDARALPTAAWNSNAPAVLLMLDLGFDVFASGPDGGTLLHCAAWRGLADLVESILAHPRIQPVCKALIARKDATHGSTPLGWCCHGSKHCHSPAGDYPRIARALLAAGAAIGPNVADATPEVRAVLGL